MILLTAGKLKLSISEDGSRVAWAADGLPMRETKNSDFWRAFMDDNYLREMGVRSSKQKYGCVEQIDSDSVVVRYSKLIGDDGREFDTVLNVYITAKVSTYPGFEMYAVIENNDKARINELMLPMLDLDTACDTNRANDMMYSLNGYGSTTPNPWEATKGNHSEYVAADDQQIWGDMHYPSTCAMAWFGLQTGGHFLYLGKQDSRLESQLFTLGVPPRQVKEPQLIITTSQMPYVTAGETVETMRCFISLNEGDWRTGSDIYGNYARSTWYTPPKTPDWVKHLTGWQRVICRHQYGGINFTYADLPRVYKEGIPAGLNCLMIFGWWKGRFDNGYPIYEPDDELGGEEGLRAAIEEIQAMGGRVALYTNGQLIDAATDYFREKGHRLCRVSIDGNNYMDSYPFGNTGTSLRAYGHKAFVTACPGTPEWIELQVEHEKYKLSLGADSAFYDQIGGNMSAPCFNESHPHGKRAAQAEEGRRECMKAIFDNCPDGCAVGTEKATDMLLPYVHYVHGAQNGPIFWAPSRPCPEMLLRTFPETVHTNRFVHDDKPEVDGMLNHAFVYGFRFDICPYRGRTDISKMPRLIPLVKRLVDLHQQYKEFFYEGTFVCDTDIQLPANAYKGEFLSADGKRRLISLCNNSKAEITVDVCGKSVTIPALDVACVVLD